MSAMLWRFALIAVVRIASGLRVERTAGKLRFAFGDCKLTLILGGELLWGETHDLGRAVFCVAHAERAAHFNGSRALVTCKQHVADRRLQFLVCHGVGCSVGGRTERARALSATFLFGFSPFWTISMPVQAAAVAALHETIVPRSSLRFTPFVTRLPWRAASFAASAWQRGRRSGCSAPK
eukprot:6214045-Pleurochrysis_carterae.AAC.1